MSEVPLIELNDGNRIPQLGFGVFQIGPSKAPEAVQRALEVGYRHIDTAEMYRNEAGVGEGIRASGLGRDEVFVTSKLNNGFHEPDDARRAIDGTLEELGFDYVDLFLIHWPLPTLYDGDFVSTWQTLEEFKSDGRARSIGVSNFQVDHLEQLAAETGTVPPSADRGASYLLNEEVSASPAPTTASRSRRGLRSRRATCSATRRSPRSPGESGAHARRRSCCAGTCSAATSSSRSR